MKPQEKLQANFCNTTRRKRHNLKTKACDLALKQQILATFHNDYVEGVVNKNVGFTKTTKLELLNHLSYSYETITPNKMEDNTNDMVTPYDPSNPINKFLYKLIGDYKYTMHQTPHSKMHKSSLRHVFLFKIID